MRDDMKPTIRLTSSNMASRGFKPPAPVAPKAEPVAAATEPVRVEAPMDNGIASAIHSLREQIAAMPARPRPAGMDMELRRDPKTGAIQGAAITFNWS
ncbi:MAG: hypothetical protein ACRC2H_00855 [Silanimonas sp.]